MRGASYSLKRRVEGGGDRELKWTTSHMGADPAVGLSVTGAQQTAHPVGSLGLEGITGRAGGTVLVKQPSHAYHTKTMFKDKVEVVLRHRAAKAKQQQAPPQKPTVAAVASKTLVRKKWQQIGRIVKLTANVVARWVTTAATRASRGTGNNSMLQRACASSMQIPVACCYACPRSGGPCLRWPAPTTPAWRHLHLFFSDMHSWPHSRATHNDFACMRVWAMQWWQPALGIGDCAADACMRLWDATGALRRSPTGYITFAIMVTID